MKFPFWSFQNVIPEEDYEFKNLLTSWINPSCRGTAAIPLEYYTSLSKELTVK
jgi:hypothetical protein